MIWPAIIMVGRGLANGAMTDVQMELTPAEAMVLATTLLRLCKAVD